MTASGPRFGGSFRDPSGRVFFKEGVVYRKIHGSYQKDWDQLIASGLHKELVKDGLIVPHEDCGPDPADPGGTFKIIRPQKIPFISYPYEWCFGQLRAAALTTLEIQRRALAHGMSLKDASAFNIQFIGTCPVLIDTLSFETLREDRPWAAYRQFCEHFLAPLALMAYRDARFGRWGLAHPDGFPLDLAVPLLPWRAWLRPGLLTHLFLHACACRASGSRPPAKPSNIRIGRTTLLAMIDGLESAVRSLRPPRRRTAWQGYYACNSYSEKAMNGKKEIVAKMIDEISPGDVWDLGSNKGIFSRPAADKGIRTVALDHDPQTVEDVFCAAAAKKDRVLLPLVMDLTDPSGRRGWNHEERMSLCDRGPADLVLALALTHHLAIAGNVPFEFQAEFMSRIARNLIIEFIPKDDPQIARMLEFREDVYAGYGRQAFEEAFVSKFVIDRAVPVPDSGRVLYRMTLRP